MTGHNTFDDDREYRSSGCCVECGQDASNACMCGALLCPEHFEQQAGFCSNVMDYAHSQMFENLEP